MNNNEKIYLKEEDTADQIMEREKNKDEMIYLTEKEIEMFFHAADDMIKNEKNIEEKKRYIRNKALFAVMYYCGLKINETVNLSLKDYTKSKHEISCTRSKGSKSNVIKFQPAFEWVEKALKKHISVNKPTEYLFINKKKGMPLSRQTCDVAVRSIFANTSIPYEKWNCRALRKSIGVHLVNRGVNIYELQYWYGHVGIANTATYYKQKSTFSKEELYEKVNMKIERDDVHRED